MAVPHSGIPSPAAPPVDAEVDDLVADTVVTGDLTATAAEIGTATIDDLTAPAADVTALTADDATIGDLEVTGTLTATIDHGSQTGLTDEADHPQYALVTGGGKTTVSTVAASGSSETIDLANGNVHAVTLTDDCTLAFTGATNGKASQFALILKQDVTGGREVTWPASVAWAGGVAPTLSTDGDAVDIFRFLSVDGGTTWFGEYAPSVTDGALGTLGYAQVTANQGSITTETDLTGLSVAVTVGTSRRIRVTGYCHMNSSVASDRFGIAIWEGANELQVSRVEAVGASLNVMVFAAVVLTPSAGAHTYKLTGERATGSGTIQMAAQAAFPAFILVEDIGPA